jgi:glycosyltransferase involved in cell wall biosynthesis
MSSLKAKGVHLRCVLAGSCDAGAVDYREKVADRVRTLDLTNDVEIIDGPDDARLKQLMLDADLVVQPSLAEGLGLVVIEALLRGVPAIASPTEGACDVLKDFPMLLMPGFSPSHIAEAIIDALSRPNRYAAEASRAARSLRARFDPSVNVGRLLEIYQGRTGEAR